MKKVIYLLLVIVGFSGCTKDSISEDINSMDLKAANVHSVFTTPELSNGDLSDSDIQIEIIAGENGATGGLSVRWMTLEDYLDSNEEWNDELAGHVLLNGRANEEYSLMADESFFFNLSNYVDGEGSSWNRLIECGQSYVFKVRAHQDGKIKKSEYSEPIFASTEDCEDDCNLLEQEEYSTTYTEDEVLGSIDGTALNLKFLFLDLLEEGAPQDGYFNDAKLVALYSYYIKQKRAGNRSIDLTYNYTVEDGECSDSADLTLVVTN